MATIQGIYIALFGRPADPLGLDYFNSITDGGQDLSEIDSLAGQPEYLARFEGMNSVQIVTSIYQELFGRNPDAAGLAFFVAALNSGEQDINTIAINIYDGAQNEDLALLQAKEAAADQFTDAVRADNDALAAYQGQQGIEFGQRFLDQVTSADVEFTDEQVAAQVEAFGDNEEVPGLPGTTGDTFTLTAAGNVQTGGVDEVEGTANNDTFRAVIAGSLDSTDIIDGGAGQDVLNIADAGIAAGAVPVIRNVERINNSDNGAGLAAATLDLSSVTGAEQIWSVGSGGANAFAYTNAAIATVFGASNAAAAVTVNVDYAGTLPGTTDTAMFAVDDNNANLVTFASADAAAVESISLIAAGGAGAGATGDAIDDQVNVDAFTAATTLTVTGAGDISIGAGAISTLTTVNASAATGAVTINATGAAAAVTFTGGSGVDTFFGGAGNDIINGGAGNDVLLGQNGNDTITGGAGADTMTGGAGTDTFVIAGEVTVGGFDIITDFNVGNDSLEFGGAAGSATNYLEVTAVALSFNDAREAANNALDSATGVSYAAVQVGGNSYVFADTNADGSADTVVQLTGVALGAIDQTDII